MQYKLVASDMDGTLLDDNKNIPKENVEAIREMIDAGYIFAICTGRPGLAVKKYFDQLHMKGPSITYNGGKIILAESMEVIYEQGMEWQDAVKLEKQAAEFQLGFIFWCDDQLFVNKADKWTTFYANNVGRDIVVYDDFEALAKKGITKMIWTGEACETEKWKDWYEENEFLCLTAAASTPNMLEFFSAKTSKAKAMEKLGEIYGIKQEEMIACGDMYNDQSMIEYAGLGVVMKNGAEDLKEIAQYVTEADNNQGGVAEVIRKFVLNKE